MVLRRVRKLLDDPIWLVLVLATVIGVFVGDRLAHVETNEEEAVVIWGRAWRTDISTARSTLATMFSLQITVLTIVLSLNASTIQSAANQYSPRLVPFYLRHAPVRRAVPMFALSGAYMVTAVRTLGLMSESAVRPRPVLSGAFLLLLATFVLLTVEIGRTTRFLRVERVLGLVRDATLTAVRRAQGRAEPTVDPEAKIALSPSALPLTAPAAGFIVEIDVPRLARYARRAGARVHVCRGVGDYLDHGEVVGWVDCDAGGRPSPRLLRTLARALVIGPERELDYDPLYGIRILADVASRAVSSSVNDAYTARQALQQMRTVLRCLAREPLGDRKVLDPDGSVRVSVMSSELGEFLSVAADGPLRSGAADPEVLDGVLEIALEVGLIARDAQGQAAVAALIARVLADARDYGRLDPGRLQRLDAEAELVRAALEQDLPRTERHARSTWALMPTDGRRAVPPGAQPQPG